MTNTTTSMIFAALIAMASAAVEGVQTVRYALTDDLVDGVGSYQGQPVRAGDSVMIRWDITKRTDCPGMNSRVWDGEGGFHVVEAQKPTALPNGRVTPLIPTRIPELAPAGTLTLTVKGWYDCDKTERHYWQLDPVKIEVIE